MQAAERRGFDKYPDRQHQYEKNRIMVGCQGLCLPEGGYLCLIISERETL